MLETLAVVTFLLTNGSKAVMSVYPPGGEYHKHFAPICEQNKPRISEQVRKLFEDKKISQPEHTEKILSIQIFCMPSSKA